MRYIFEDRNGLMVPVSETRGEPKPASPAKTQLDLDIDEEVARHLCGPFFAQIAHNHMLNYCYGYGEGFYDDDEPA